jgi:hypothetical protein
MEAPNNPPTVDKIEAMVKDFDQAWGRLWEVMFRHFTKVETAGLFSPEAVDTGEQVFALMEAVLHYRDKDVQKALQDGYVLGEAYEPEDTKPEVKRPVDCGVSVLLTVEVLVEREDLPEEMYEKDGDLYVLTDDGRDWFVKEAELSVDCGMYDFVVHDGEIDGNSDGDFEVHPF